MKNFLEKYFTVIVLVISVLTFLKGCNDSRETKKVRKEITEIKNNTYTKKELSVELKIVGLESEKRMIQSTDRKILDVKRQTEIENEISELRKNGK